MKCDQCGIAIEKGEERLFHREWLCEDCYMDALSPPHLCDPWAEHSAKPFTARPGTSARVNETQEKILQILRETGGSDSEALAMRLGIPPTVIQRELAALKHMEKAKISMHEGIEVYTTW